MNTIRCATTAGIRAQTLAALVAAGAMLALVSCGGGGSSSSDVAPTPTPTPTPTSITLSGTAASGAPFNGATVTVADSSGATFPAAGTAAVTTAADGSYSITLPASAKPPFVLQAARDDKTLVSAFADAKDSTVNITSVTNLIASRLSSSGDPTMLASELKANPTLFDTTKLNAKVDEVVTLIKPVTTAIGDATNPLTGKFAADGSGQDKVLDSLSISITPSSATSVNIEVAAKAKSADGSNPTVVAFTNTTAPTAALPAVAAADLVPSGTTPMIADLLKRITACFALPLSSRVNSTAKAATDITATECKTIFSGNDPSKYKHNGGIVSSNGAFGGIFNAAGNNNVFDRGNFEYMRSNGDIVFSYRSTDASGIPQYSLLVAISEGTPAKLMLIGNQYVYSGGVNAYQQYRDFINQPAANYYSTGYNLNVNNQVSAGSPIFNRVEVTTPKGTVITLKPTVGNANLDLIQNGKPLAGTSFVRLRSVYADPTNKGDPATSSDNTGLYFASPTYGEGDVSSIPAQSVWTFNYFLAGNSGTKADATQTYRTVSRAMTIGEIKAQALASLTNQGIADAKSGTVTNPANPNSGFINTPAKGPVSVAWVVPNNALPPAQIKIWGSAPAASGTTNVNFDDQAGVLPSARTGTIACTKATTADAHCTAAGDYVAGANVNGIHLWASDSRLRQFAHFYAIYKITM